MKSYLTKKYEDRIKIKKNKFGRINYLQQIWPPSLENNGLGKKHDSSSNI